VTRNGKRLGLLRLDEQGAWLARKGRLHGFSLPQTASFDMPDRSPERVDVWISQGQMLRARQHSGNGIQVYSVLYDGLLTVSDPDAFQDALRTGIGHGKALGLGLLSVVPVDVFHPEK
jgi:CRISPR system Cascade subunit CasE